jgi:hypothetical protein
LHAAMAWTRLRQRKQRVAWRQERATHRVEVSSRATAFTSGGHPPEHDQSVTCPRVRCARVPARMRLHAGPPHAFASHRPARRGRHRRRLSSLPPSTSTYRAAADIRLLTVLITQMTSPSAIGRALAHAQRDSLSATNRSALVYAKRCWPATSPVALWYLPRAARQAGQRTFAVAYGLQHDIQQ